VPEIRATVKTVAREHGPPDRAALLAAADELWSRQVHECRMAAVELLRLHAGVLAAQDVATLERLLRTSRTWALVDALCTGVVAELLAREPSVADTLDRWARDDDFWIRRASLLSLLPALRRGVGDTERFGRYADPMLDEKEFFIRKAIGWVLRETARKDPAFVIEWLSPRIERASGVTVREAVKYLPEADRERLLAAYRSRGARSA